MVTITSLNDYLAIVCDPEDSSDSQYEYDSHELSRMNEVVKRLIMGIKKEPPEKVKEFLEVNYKYIYGYKYKKERSQKLETIRENQYEWFYRGVDNLQHLLSPEYTAKMNSMTKVIIITRYPLDAPKCFGRIQILRNLHICSTTDALPDY